MDRSVPAPKVNLSSVAPPLSPNTIFLVLTSKLPPSCGEVSVTMFNAVRLAPLPLNVVAVTPAIPVIFVELSPAIFPFAVMSPLNVPVVPDTAPLNVPVDPATVPPDIFPVTLPVTAPTKVVAVTTPVLTTLVNVDTPATFKSPLISPFPFKSNSVAVTIPVRLIEGTSNCPNNLPFNTKSPLIV